MTVRANRGFQNSCDHLFGLSFVVDLPTASPLRIGQQKSMGCVRMATDDIAMVYEMLCERVSTVKVVD